MVAIFHTVISMRGSDFCSDAYPLVISTTRATALSPRRCSSWGGSLIGSHHGIRLIRHFSVTSTRTYSARRKTACRYLPTTSTREPREKLRIEDIVFLMLLRQVEAENGTAMEINPWKGLR